MEEVLPPQTQDGAGFERTRIPQFTIFMENRVGKLAALLRILEERISVVNGLSIEESADSALVRIICCDPNEARNALKEADFTFTETDVLAVELPKRHSKPLVAICTALLSAEINIHYVYPMLVRPHGPALILYVDDPTLAAQILIRKRFVLIGESDLKV
jgi:hypothetical protein